MHVCKNCGETDLTKFGLHSTSKKPHGYCKPCRNARHKATSQKYYSTDKGKAVKASSDKKNIILLILKRFQNIIKNID